NNEFYIIDHSTTTAEAASHTEGMHGKGGDLLYRWGNAVAYDRGLTSDKKLYGQHNVQFIPQGIPNAGKVIVFNNGMGRPDGTYSSIDIIETPVDANGNYSIDGVNAYAPSSAFWIYTAPIKTDFYGQNISGVNPLANGSFVICVGPSGDFFEIDSDENQVWKYLNPVGINGIATQGSNAFNNLAFRCEFYAPDYIAFDGKVLTPGNEIELNPTDPTLCELVSVNELSLDNALQIFPNPVTDQLNFSLPQKSNGDFNIEIFNSMGEKVLQAKNKMSFNVNFLSSGIYLLKLIAGENIYTQKIVKS
ncbi:MAG: T9SS type A sorting domain-containing protein, partial [Chitinophagales bacterium]|nr:T9SS type A sorting domain-containing protein [Chitinophagales bacterium]